MDIDKLIEDNMGLVYMQLHRFNLAYDADAFSFAMEGLMNAAKTYNTKRNIKFSTYASACIYNAIMQHLRSQNKQRQISIVYYDEPINSVDDLTYADTLYTDETPDSAYEDKERSASIIAAIRRAKASISNPTTVSVIEYWESTDFTATQVEIAKELSIAQPTVSRAIALFKKQLKTELEE